MISHSPFLRNIARGVLLAFAIVCFWQAVAPLSRRPVEASSTSADRTLPTTSSGGRELLTRPIEQIRPGMRVIAQNPEIDSADTPEDLEIDPAEWRLVTYLMDKPGGGTLTIDELIRADEAVPVGSTTPLSYPELGIDGIATATALVPCPPIEAGDGRLVTATFKHSAANVIDLQVASEKEPIGTTGNHPFWSEDRQDWVQAGSLKVGERLRFYTGDSESEFQLTTVTSILPRPGPEMVYNLTVDGTHTYHVGQSGVLVHNSSKYGKELVDLGKSREAKGLNRIRELHPDGEILSQRYLRDAKGDRLKHGGSARRTDFVVVKDGKVVAIYEITGNNVNKKLQADKTREILKSGDVFIRRPGSRDLKDLIQVKIGIEEQFLRFD